MSAPQGTSRLLGGSLLSGSKLLDLWLATLTAEEPRGMVLEPEVLVLLKLHDRLQGYRRLVSGKAEEVGKAVINSE